MRRTLCLVLAVLVTPLAVAPANALDEPTTTTTSTVPATTTTTSLPAPTTTAPSWKAPAPSAMALRVVGVDILVSSFLVTTPGVSGYRFERNGTVIGYARDALWRDVGAALSAATHTYTIRAVGPAGELGAPISKSITVKPAVTIPPATAPSTVPRTTTPPTPPRTPATPVGATPSRPLERVYVRRGRVYVVFSHLEAGDRVRISVNYRRVLTTRPRTSHGTSVTIRLPRTYRGRLVVRARVLTGAGMWTPRYQKIVRVP